MPSGRRMACAYSHSIWGSHTLTEYIESISSSILTILAISDKSSGLPEDDASRYEKSFFLPLIFIPLFIYNSETVYWLSPVPFIHEGGWFWIMPLADEEEEMI